MARTLEAILVTMATPTLMMVVQTPAKLSSFGSVQEDHQLQRIPALTFVETIKLF